MSALLLLVLVSCVCFVRAEASCASCERVHEEGELHEAVKRHILTRLQLTAPPNITHALPRAALLTALRRLQAAVRQDGRVELPPEHRAEDSSEIISFAERDEMVTSHTGMFFVVSNEGNQSLLVSEASLWLYLRVLPVPPHLQALPAEHSPAPERRRSRRVSLKLYHQGGGFSSGWSLVEKGVELRRSGWHRFDLTEVLQGLFQSATRRQSVDVRCEGCEAERVRPLLLDADAARRPFLVVQARREEVGHRIRRRGLECEEGAGLCCRKQFYIDFRLLGWSDWIIAPPGYLGNYCEGSCPPHGGGAPSAAASFHTAVLNQYRLRGLGPAPSSSCCVPTKLAPMSMLYFDHEFNIVKRDVPHMVVEECGCA
ncbi:inhibin beta B chain-like [Periophthalmus magnuspinnatus]|uniref:inhibin beta B chain-like n=1 Tax=Periophthalmus magnuspinnatus TaxID=409849 RepID=UPI00145BF0DA|nr:inhibin beta B chain-like [Periophthalmus magnuspinnatus]